MAILKVMEFLRRYFSPRRNLYIPSTMIFTPLDSEEIKRDKNLKKRGDDRGKLGQPSASAQSYDEVESEILTFIEQARNIATDNFNNHLSTYAERIGSLDLDNPAIDIEIEGRTVLSEFEAELTNGADKVYNARRHLVELDREVAGFRQEHCLQRTAHYPSSRLLHFSLMLAMVLVEAILNGFFLGETHLFGLVGGIAVALVIAVINVAAGGVTGYYILPQIRHRWFWRKLAGSLGLFFYLFAILTFNLGVAHYRDAMAADLWETATTVAFQSLLNTPFGVGDMHSWLLFFIGLGFSVAAMIDGLGMDDYYPGYGKLWRKLKKLRDDYAEIKTSCLIELTEIKEAVVDDMRSTRNKLAGICGEYNEIVAARQRQLVAYQDHLRHLEQVANDLLATYRDANKCAREKDNPMPEYFHGRWRMLMPELADFEKPNQGKIEAAVQRADEVLVRQIEKMHTAYDTAVQTFKRIEELSEEELASGSAHKIVQEA